jgi:hypothetical protein
VCNKYFENYFFSQGWTKAPTSDNRKNDLPVVLNLTRSVGLVALRETHRSASEKDDGFREELNPS